jgi:hypothetical protein
MLQHAAHLFLGPLSQLLLAWSLMLMLVRLHTSWRLPSPVQSESVLVSQTRCVEVRCRRLLEMLL